MQHTTGPWVNHGGIIRDSSPEGWLVATCRFNPKDESNARLIAEAPAMLEALQEARKWIAKGIADGAYDGCVLPLAPNRWLDRTSAILARIDGEA